LTHTSAAYWCRCLAVLAVARNVNVANDILYYYFWLDGLSMSMSRVRDLTAPMHLGFINWPFVPHVHSREPQSITEAPDGPQAYTLNILRLQEEGAQMCMSK